MNGDAWSDAEDAAVLDLARSPVELAAALGRSVASVSSRRSRLLRSKREPGRDANGGMRLPRHMPRHWLLAKTCLRCGNLLPGRDFPPRQKEGGRESDCRECRSARVSDRRADESYRQAWDERAAEYHREEQRIAAERALNNRKEWTGPELELVMRSDLTDRQKAAMLGRSFYAVRHMIRKMRAGDPAKTSLAGLPRAEY